MTERVLTCHPATVLKARLELWAEIEFLAATRVRLRYRLRGEVDRVAVPPRVPSLRVDGLWKRTCFEAFIAPEGRRSYIELNLSPSTEWAAYGFDGYRDGMRPLLLANAPAIAFTEEPGEIHVTADVDFAGIADAPWPWRVGLSAVIADRAGILSYWALTHPAAKPDFHAADGFALRVERPAK